MPPTMAAMSDEVLVRVPLDSASLERLRELALSERRATSDQASILLERALARQSRRQGVPRSVPDEAQR